MEFRCEKCGKLLSVEAGHGHLVTCPHCLKVTSIPEGLASLPRPIVPGNVPSAPTSVRGDATEASGQPASDELQEELVETGPNKTVAAMMPWVLSVLLHLSVGLIAGFLGYVAVQRVVASPANTAIYVPGEEYNDESGGSENPGISNDTNPAMQDRMKHVETGYSHHEAVVGGATGTDEGQLSNLISAAGGGGGGGGWAPFGHPPSNGGPPGMKATLIGLGGNAHHVIYCIDSSGSMAFSGHGEGSVFDSVRRQMQISISHLRDVQDFHVVFFQEGPPIEMPSKRLLPATPESRVAAVRFIHEQVARGGGGTDPIPALNRCFDLMRTADSTRQGKQIYLLTDGAFRDNEAVLRCIRERNKAKDVHIFTYLYGQQDDESVVRLMRQIAVETGGKYKNITE
jgi:hypothetical protein